MVMSHAGLILVGELIEHDPRSIDNAFKVTGVTGFIAGHVADQLVTAGYRVRGSVTVASAKGIV
jgi:F420-0:gamma-glutamyl ligase-like protein